MNLVTLAFLAPVIAVETDAPTVLHAVTMESAVEGWGDGNDPYFASACGLPHLKLLGSQGQVIEWPPRVSSLAVPMVRCRECHRVTGRKRPRSTFIPKRA